MAALQQDDIKLTKECMESFCKVTGLGCIFCAPSGDVLYETGYSCKSCRLCEGIGASGDLCVVSRVRAWHDAERFGGKYIYGCPMGLTCIATPVQTDFDPVGYLTVGPFLMVDEEDYMQCELGDLASQEDKLRLARRIIGEIPRLDPGQAEPVAKQLFLAVGGMGSAFSISRLLEQQDSDYLMGDLTEFTSNAKQGDGKKEYPIGLEKELLHAISVSDKTRAEQALNEILGYIFFLTGGDFGYIRARICELLVLSSRAAIEGGADAAYILSLCQRYIGQMQDIYDIDKLCYWLTTVLRQFIGCLFDCDSDRRNVLPHALTYIQRNCQRRITLEEVAGEVFLSPSYFSRIFRKETGLTFSGYVAGARIDRAKTLLRQEDLTITEIAIQTGFGDQSHFTKAFKNATGVTPGVYRKRRGRGYNELAQ